MIIKNNASDPYIFKKLKDICFDNSNFPWFVELENGTDLSWAHLVWYNGKRVSPVYTACIDVINSALQNNYTKIYKIRFGMHTKSNMQVKSNPHVDMTEEHKTGLIYLNDSDGDTIFYKEKFDKSFGSLYDHYQNSLNGIVTIDKTITPEENKLVVFDGLTYHSSTSPVNTLRRVVLNFNYI